MTVGQRISFVAVCATFVLVPIAIGWGIFDYALLPKRIVFQATVAVALAGYLADLLTRRTKGPMRGPIQTALLTFGALALVSTVRSTDLLDSAVELAYLGSLIGLSLCVGRFDLRDIERLAWATALTGLGVSLVGIAQYLGVDSLHLPSNGPPSSTFGYRNFAAMYLAGAIPIAAWVAIRAERPIPVAVSSLAVAAMLTFLAYTRTRGALLGIGIAAIVTLVVVLGSGSRRRIFIRTTLGHAPTWKRVAWAASACSVVALSLLAPRFTDTGLQRFDEKKTDLAATLASIASDTGDRGRVRMWRNTLDLIADHPLLGVGPGGWYREYPPYDRGAMIRPNSSPKRPHNDYLWIASEYGLPAALAFLAALALALASLYRMAGTANSPWSLAGPLMATSLLAVSVHAFFSFPKEQPQAAMLVYFFLGLGAFGHRSAARTISRPVSILLIGLTLVGAVAGTGLGAAAAAFDRHYLAALEQEGRENWPAVLAETEAGLERGVFRPHMLVIHGRALERAQRYEDAARAYERALELAPHSWHAYNGAGVAYKRLNRLDDALRSYKAALALFPGSTVVRNNLGALYRATGDEKAAESEYRIVLQSLPDNPGANNNMGNIYKARGELDSARVSYERALAAEPDLAQAHNNLADLYRIQKQPTRALEHYATAARLAPSEPMVHWGMGVTYEDLGDPVRAEAAYRKAIEVRPDFPRAYFNLGELLFGLKRYVESRQNFEQFLAWYPHEDDRFARFAKNRVKTNRTYQQRLERARGDR